MNEPGTSRTGDDLAGWSRMTTAMEPGRLLYSRRGRRGEKSVRRGLVRRLSGFLCSDSHLSGGKSADLTGSSLFRNGPSQDPRGLESLVRGLAGSVEGRSAIRCGDHPQRDSRYPERCVSARLRTGVWVLRRGVVQDLGSRCGGRRLRTGRVDGSHRSVEDAEKVRREVTAGPNPDTSEGREQATARRADVAAYVILTARGFQRATPRKDVTTALARTDNTPNRCPQHPKAGSQRPKDRVATWSRHVATPDGGWPASANRLAAVHSDLAARDRRRTARAENVATSRNLLAASDENPVLALQGPSCARFSTPIHEGGHREQQTRL